MTVPFAEKARRKLFQNRSMSTSGDAAPVGSERRSERPDATEVVTNSPKEGISGVKVSKLVCGLAPRNNLPISLQLPKAKAHQPFSGEQVPAAVLESFSSSSAGSSSDDEEEGPALDKSDAKEPAVATAVEYGSKVDRVEFTEPDVYGQKHPIETPALLASKLIALEQELEALPAHKKVNLHKAMSNCPELLTNKFKLQFLRCECFHERRAAKRYVKYWDKRVDIFGIEKAFLPLTQHEALRDDALALSKGAVTLSGHKDSSGRYIIYVDPTRQEIGAYSYKSMTRAIWYVFHAALEDEETQKKGVVFLVDLRIVNLSLLDKDLALLCAGSVQGCLPARLSGIHGCSPPRIFSVMFPILKVLLGDLRKRVRLHAGPSLERVQTELDKYSLTKDVVPTDLGGHVKVNHGLWLEKRRLHNE